MVKGGMQVRKQWESSALLLSESKVCRWGAVSAGSAPAVPPRTGERGCWAVLPWLAHWPLQQQRSGAPWSTSCKAGAAPDLGVAGVSSACGGQLWR